MAATETFRTWRATHPDSGPLLETFKTYISSLGAESWESEAKAAISDKGNFGPRKAVAALANRWGGEVFLGVDKNLNVPGSSLSLQALESFLHQASAPKSEVFISDLMECVRAPVTPIIVSETPEGRTAFVVEVVDQALPVYVWNDEHKGEEKLELWVRQGSETRLLGGVDGISWFRDRRRASILRALYLEFDLMSRQVWPDIGWSTGITPVLPYFQRCMEDASLYTMLRPDDRKALLGEAGEGGRGGGSPGFLGRLLRVRSLVEVQRSVFKQEVREPDNLAMLDYGLMTGASSLSNLWNELKQDRENFKRWLQGQGIRIE